MANNKIVIFQNQQLTLENIPSEINGLKISDVQKILLLKGHSVLVEDQSVSINKEETGLRIQGMMGKDS